MIVLRFRKEAADDLEEIVRYFEQTAPEALPKILDDIHHGLSRLTEFPRLGAPVPDRDFRRLVTLRYQFKIAYQPDEAVLTVLGIFRFQDREA